MSPADPDLTKDERELEHYADLQRQALAWRGQRNTARAERDEALAEVAKLTDQRDGWIRLFNRLEAAISHHKRDSGFADANDESLWYARDRILKEASGPDS